MTADFSDDSPPRDTPDGGAPVFQTAARLSDLRDGRTKLVHLGARPIVLIRRGERIYALDNTCPHAGAPLSRGHIHEHTEGDYVSCPMHHWRFRLATGARLDGPQRPGVRTYRVRVVGDEIQVETPGDEPEDHGRSA